METTYFCLPKEILQTIHSHVELFVDGKSLGLVNKNSQECFLFYLENLRNKLGDMFSTKSSYQKWLDRMQKFPNLKLSSKDAINFTKIHIRKSKYCKICTMEIEECYCDNLFLTYHTGDIKKEGRDSIYKDVDNYFDKIE